MDTTTVAIDPLSKFAYVVNRQADSVWVYSISQDSGALTLIGNAATGSTPWRATVDPSGKFLYVGNESSSSVSVYSIKKDGTLTTAGSTMTQAAALDISVISPK
jgi:6-phosphogluconolactonase (cycloisomerase 2 family)